MDARPAILKSRLFPLKERLSLKDIKSALDRLADIGCVRLYECDGKPYLYLPSWEVHQQIRAKRGKYPAPDSTCKQMISDDIKCSLNQIQSGSESNQKTNPSYSAEPETASTPPVITLPLNDGSEYPVSQEQSQEWAGLYPAVDVIQQLRGMRGWLLSNPNKRKTRRGIGKFINGWLSREQDKGGSKNPDSTPGKPNAKPVPSDEDYLREWGDT